MNLILLGAPGSGKGTQSKFLQETLSLTQISTGDLVRKEIQESTALGREIKEIVESGKYPSDEVILNLATKAIEKIKENFICDGFPRTLNQAKMLESIFEDRHLTLDGVINIKVDEDVLIKRLTGRLSCMNCGAIYNIYYTPSTVTGVCDKCGSRQLHQRTDDSIDFVENRLQIYREKTAPLVEFYRGLGILYEVNGMRDPKEVSKEILEKINEINHLIKHKRA